MDRKTLREQFLLKHNLSTAEVTPLVPDASARCYFRIVDEGHSMMLMDAPPEAESCNQFIRVSRYLKNLGARVPEIIAADASNGFILLEDLGNHTMTWLLNHNADEASLYRTAIDALITIQQAFPAHHSDTMLPPYDLAATLTEANLFTDWYLPAKLERKMSREEKSEFVTIWTTLYDNLPDCDPVLVHRDFHVDNLLMIDDQCAMLDYQDALLGSPVYDLMSLVEDARRDIAPALKVSMIDQWQKSMPLKPTTFDSHYAFWAAQRHCKVAGIFVRLWLRDDKSQYLKHIPRVIDLLEQHLNHPTMTPLKKWIRHLLPEVEHQSLSADTDRLRTYIN